MTAKTILDAKGTSVVTIDVAATLDDAIGVLTAHNIGAVIVTRPGEAVSGILSERDIIRVLDGAPAGFRSTKVAEVMTSTVFTAGPDATVDQLLGMMTEKRIRHVPICDADTLLGVVSIGDVVKRRIEAAEHEAMALKDYISA